MEDLKKTLGEEIQKVLNERKKKIETDMYWWLNMKRPFHIGDEYIIYLEKIDVSNKSVKIRIVNSKAKIEGKEEASELETLLSLF